MHDSQAVHTQWKSDGPPTQGIHVPGTEVRVAEIGHKILPELFEIPPFGVDGWWTKLDAIGTADFLIEGPPGDDPVKPDETIEFG